MNDAVKDTGVSRSSILSQIDGKRKYCLWYSHIYYNKVILHNGKEVKISDPRKDFDFNDYMVVTKSTLKDLLLRYKLSGQSTSEFVEENWKLSNKR